MNYNKLRKLREDLKIKPDRTKEEEELLNELISLAAILDKVTFSLASSSSNCPTCGQPLKK